MQVQRMQAIEHCKINFSIVEICLHMQDSRESHLTVMKCTLRYLQSTLDYSFLLRRSAASKLTVYTDADWVGCSATRRSTSGYMMFLGANLVSWSSKRQNVVSCSSADVEYRIVANGVVEAYWLRQLRQELHVPLTMSTLIYCDNVSAIYLSTNPIQHQHMKHVEIDLHFVWEHVATSDVHVLHMPMMSQFTDIFTKGLPTSLFSEFRSSLNIRSG
jgi:hypothetical protein